LSSQHHDNKLTHIDKLGVGDAPWRTPGFLMIIGGADRLDHEGRLARLFLRLVERVESHTSLRDVVLISTATRHPEILTGDYLTVFQRLGLSRERVHAPFIRTRDEAFNAEFVRLVAGAAGVFITGGDQYALTQTLDRTPVEEAIRTAYGAGAIVAGTSAGATAMGGPMIVAGGGSGELRRGMVQITSGLGWAGEDIIIDTHFGARGRFPRLASVVAEHPFALAVGVDENTCLLVDGEGHAEVAGAGVVYFVDAGIAVLNTTHEVSMGQPASIGPLRVHVLAAGQAFDLRERLPVLARAAPNPV
jgi:cyanophycinase